MKGSEDRTEQGAEPLRLLGFDVEIDQKDFTVRLKAKPRLLRSMMVKRLFPSCLYEHSALRKARRETAPVG